MGRGWDRSLSAIAWLLLAVPPALPAQEEPAPVSEVFQWLLDENLAEPPMGVMICHFGFSEHTVEFSRRVLSELVMPRHRAHVAFFRIPETQRQAMEEIKRDFPETAHTWEPMEAFAQLCSVFVLSQEDPKFNLEEIRLISRGTSSLLVYFQSECASRSKQHSCRFFHASWQMLVPHESTKCGRHFCVGSMPEKYEDSLYEGVDCDFATSPFLPPSQISQWQQDWFVYRNFFHGTELDRPAQLSGEAPRRGVYVDVGAFHPIHLSNTFFFERCLGWKGVCAEPTPSWEPYFGAYRPSCQLVQNCVWSANRSVTMSFLKDPIETYIQDEPSGASGAPNVLISDGNAAQGSEFKATCRTLEDILTSAGLRKPARVDYMSVDAEAAEVEIFRVFPFEEFDVSVISVEVQAKNYYELDVIFATAGYAKLAVLGGDHVYAKMDRELKLPDGATEWHQILAKDFHHHGKPQTLSMGGDGR